MGLAEPRKRIKISHDPRNLGWVSSTDSFGQRLMQQQGWKSGQSLGAHSAKIRYADTDAAKIAVKVKDDTLGLGASLKSKDVAHQKTGFDAFQGLLGRLNAKTDEELKEIEQKIEDKKLATYALGRWGGMVFVPGGLLIQKDPLEQKPKAEKNEEVAEQADLVEGLHGKATTTKLVAADDEAKRRAEKEQRRKDKKKRKEHKLTEKTEQLAHGKGLPTPDSSSSNEAEENSRPIAKSSKKRQRFEKEMQKPGGAIAAREKLRNGRHILRGRNIEAKRAAFADLKGLDEIFMRKV